MKKLSKIIGLIAAILFLAACIFRVQHWWGGSLLMVIAVPLLLFGYFLPFVIEQNKTENNKIQKTFNIINVIFIMIVGAAFLMKFMHWPGCGPMLYLATLALILLIILQVIALNIETDPAKKDFKFQSLIFLIIFTGFAIFMSFRTPNIDKQVKQNTTEQDTVQ